VHILKGRLWFRYFTKPIKLKTATESKTVLEMYQGAVRLTGFSVPLNIPDDLTVTIPTMLSLLTYYNLMGKGHHMYMDNYYTHPKLFQHLMCCGIL
jgi:hypothetical protein